MNIKFTNKISVEDYNNLRSSAGWTIIDPSQAQTGINNSLYIVTAKCLEKSIGLVRVVGDGGYICMLVDVIVLPEYQGKGIGRKLMEAAMNYIYSSLKEGQTVYVNLMSVHGKEPFYEKFGFTKRPIGNLGSGMTQWITKN